jgi:hypothetical protein
MKVVKHNLSAAKKKAPRTKINKDLKETTYETAPQFIKDKIDKGRKMIAIAGLPE